VLQRLASILTQWSLRWVPDAWVIAVILTVVTFVLALVFTATGPYELIQHWGSGFWSLHSFAMQMALIVVTGYVLSTSPPFRRLLGWLADRPKSPPQAVALVAAVSMILAWLNWGLSIVGSALLVRHVARKQPGVDYGLLVCAAYLGLGGMWHAGLSASAPLVIATPGHFLEDQVGVVPVGETIFTSFNLGLSAVILVLWTVMAYRMHPGPADAVPAHPALLAEPEVIARAEPAARTPAERLFHMPWVNLFVGAIGLVWLFWNFRAKGLNAGITLDTVIFAFLILGILLHRTPVSFLGSSAEAGQYIWGVVIQFPFYAGMFGIIRDSGLAEAMAGWFVHLTSARHLPLTIYWYSGILNYFVPSGGAKWAIEAPYLVAAAKQLGVSARSVILAYAWGDMMTDIIQPFWAIPLLGITKARFHDIVGYGLVFFIVYAVVTSLAFLIVAPLGLR